MEIQAQTNELLKTNTPSKTFDVKGTGGSTTKAAELTENIIKPL